VRGTVTEAYVLRRSDYQETSRIVMLFTRELGRVSCLARGAHRDHSPFLGAVDLWHRVEARVGRRPGDLQVLLAMRVLHGNRGLMAAARSAAAVHLTRLFCSALPEGRPDPELFDLFKGGLMLLELVDPEQLPLVRLALEVKFLATLGLLPELGRCAACGEPLFGPALLATAPDGGLECGRHGAPGIRIAPHVRQLLAALASAKGRELPRMTAAPAALAGAARISTRLLERALERRFTRRAPRASRRR
jgi:DNA repair protein RecO (recombination protein O)